ncbi:MAG: hypothetical protein A2252_04680 [Elusimicrobia bacterium RIFOXYA2_FULL_39_19]|nr:MAG: hypothetical protein A2252_04680 [Elusimicrobia bacterium RIFOXYA2_FULL_39_19]
MNRQPRILIVDDDKNVVESVKIVLETIDKNYDIDTAYDGITASVKLFDFQPDLVILDIEMPGQSGAGVCKQIKMHRHLENTKILILTGNKHRISEMISLGADTALVKPMDIRDLEHLVTSLLHRQCA